MGFNPLKEKGTPIEKQIQNWSDLNVRPYDKNDVHPYTRTRIILMNGIEAEGVIFGHQFARHTNDIELRRKLAMTRRVEQQQQKMINWMIPADESALEVTIGYEQVAVDLTAWLARTEPDPYVKAALDFALIEDFDHLYRYANMMEMVERKMAGEETRELTEIMPGRPTKSEHRHPFDSVRRHVNFPSAETITKLHILTIVAGEQQTMNFYMNVGPQAATELGRGLYLEIAQIEEQHVSHYESLIDPNSSWFERLLLHEYNECYMYYSCMESETDPRIKKMWQRHLEDEVTHVRMAAELLRENEGREAEQLLPDSFPELTVFQSNKDYVRDIIEQQVDWTAKETEYVPASDLGPESRYQEFQAMVNLGVSVPSQQVIEENIITSGRDYRVETEGPHPVERFRSRETVTL